MLMFEHYNLKGKKIALMGGAGFIGHHIALRLKELGADPHVIDGLQVNNLGYHSSGYTNNPNSDLYIAIINERLDLLRKAKVNLDIIDIREYHTVSSTLSKLKPDVVIHLAAIAHANRSNKDPFSTFDHSLRTLENVLDAIRSSGTHIIYFSSSMVYGNFDGEAVVEEKECNPLGIYGALKYGAEKLVIGYNQVFNLPYTIIRPSALYGQRCVSRRVGQAFIENAMMGKTLTINGDGSDSLDFTYIDDLVQGIIHCIANKNAVNETFNLTYGAAQKINEMAEIILEVFPDAKLEYKPKDVLMPERGTLCINKARELLGYCPKFPMEAGFRKYIAWYKEFYNSNASLFNLNHTK